mmetsp:Transcript_111338/g.359294  ORF Transcript_111338/g.359294 Transcript_111338/m.359294 type:complete len:365 (+) Transcript_111338:685-1779(+)
MVTSPSTSWPRIQWVFFLWLSSMAEWSRTATASWTKSRPAFPTRSAWCLQGRRQRWHSFFVWNVSCSVLGSHGSDPQVVMPGIEWPSLKSWRKSSGGLAYMLMAPSSWAPRRAACGAHEVSMPECHFASFLERMAASLAYFKGFQMRQNLKFPNLEAWFKALEARDSYKGLAGDFYTHAHDLPPQVGGCAFNGEHKDYQEAIDGASWRLPLPVDESATPLEPLLLNTAAESEAARREAARKLISNRKGVVPFCLRGAGRGGFPQVSAPLSDPRASPSGDAQVKAAVDEALRGVASHLLQGGGAAILPEAVGPSAFARHEDVEVCLKYFQDRVGVPRDMSFPAARQLRAHIGSYLEATIAVSTSA